MTPSDQVDLPELKLNPVQQRRCAHAEAITSVRPESLNTCPECVALGDSWVHLRVCMSCGHVGCCDSSKNKHATKHFQASGHPIIRSLEPGESWAFCYVDGWLE